MEFNDNESKRKKIMILTFYRIITESSKEIYITRAQYNRINKMVESSTKYCEIMIRDLTNFIAKEEFDNILIAGDINKDIISTNIK